MTPDEQTVAGEGDEEELHYDRLMALLHDLVRKHGGRRGAAGVLGIDRRTVAACMDGRGMSWRMREALERGLQEGAGSAAARQREAQRCAGAAGGGVGEGASRGPRCRQRRDREAAGGRSPEMGVVGAAAVSPGSPAGVPRGRLKLRAQPGRGRRRPRQRPGRRRPVSRSGCTPSW